MLLEFFAFIGLISLSMIALAEFRDGNEVIGIIGCVFIVLMGVWLLNEPIQIRSGETLKQTGIDTTVTNSTFMNLTNQTFANTTSETTFGSTKKTVYDYADLTINFFGVGGAYNIVFGLVFMLLGMLGAYKYALNLKSIL